ncbi:MAG TPA: OmpH family outer membrane protein [Vicinamibacteria bacterium]|nr:OmpH family outer membrane protein [Vicinamibacteria bacterium]
MSFWKMAGLAVLIAYPGLGLAQETKIRVIDIERIAAESAEGKKLFESLKAQNDKIMEERAKKEQEIREMQAKLNSEILSQDAKVRLQRDIQRKQTEAQRWLEDVQAEFEVKRQEGEATFQEKLAPIVEEVARENGIGLIIRATPGLTFVLDDSLDISALVVEKLDAKAAAAPPGDSSSWNR